MSTGFVARSSTKRRDDGDGQSVCSSSSSSEGPGTTTGEESHHDGHDAKGGDGNRVDGLALRDSGTVRRAKIGVFVALVLAAAGIGTLIYFLTSDEEAGTCQQTFHAYSKELAKRSDAQIATIFSHVNTVAAAITSNAVSSNSTFPNVTLPNFHELAKGVGQNSAVVSHAVLFAPKVRDSDRKGWEAYAKTQDWIADEMKYSVDSVDPGRVPSKIYSYSHEDYEHPADHEHDDDEFVEGIKFPLWQVSPVPTNASILNMDLFTHPSFQGTIETALFADRDMLSGVQDLDFLYETQGLGQANGAGPRSTAVIPVRSDFYEGSAVVGFVFGTLLWADLFEGVLPPDGEGIIAVVSDPCSRDFAFLIEGENATFLGFGSAENFTETTRSRYHDEYEIAEFVRDNDNAAGTVQEDHREACEITLTLYSTQAYEESCQTNLPAVYTSVVVMVLVGAIVTFAVYDFWVNRRQQTLLADAKRADAIVSSLFPKHVQKRMMEEAKAHDELAARGNWKGKLYPYHDPSATGPQGATIADLYAEATIMFADIVGFTQWSSCRVPSEVIALLEAIFTAFDEVAHHRGVYKVETVGDCYVAACGVPEPRKDHALTMGRFARDCLVAFNNVVKQLENELGPDTGELGIRVGIHSGPVTAGVLRGERSRFQLFGDTMNTCSRIESTGERNRIHMSHETADILTACGKGHWCRKRESTVMAKGKGVLSTFWLETRGDTGRSAHSSSQGTDDEQAVQDAPRLEEEVCLPTNVQGKTMTVDGVSQKTLRLARWNADILLKKLCKVIARREALQVKPAPKALMHRLERNILERKTMTMEEVKDVVAVPKCDAEIALQERTEPTIDLGPAVTEQLKSYLMTIALLYRDNSFHGFEHASHVTMSVVKLFHRVIETDHGTQAGATAEEFVDSTYGIGSDPLTRFSVVFAALIHDVDHQGVPNLQLQKEEDPVAAAYGNKSPAEQNSLDIAWSLLMQDEFTELRAAIYSTPEELAHFRQILVNAVMATDIMDKDLSLARKARWAKAFSESSDKNSDPESAEDENRNRKASIVLEHLIQASDVAHTMQHWNIYRKWNTLFFEECYKAYLEGRADKDPAETWYEGELGFFDYYIIPLALKLKDCGVFGVSGDEYMVYAVRNRKEWENQGRELVEEMVNAARTKLQKIGSQGDSDRIAI